MVELHISVEGGDEEATSISLYRRLSRDPEVLRAADVTLHVRYGDLAGAVGLAEVVHVFVSDVVAVGGLATAMTEWCKSRRVGRVSSEAGKRWKNPHCAELFAGGGESGTGNASGTQRSRLNAQRRGVRH
ncbi:effector-associated constant component EACC1 [Sinosporangium siamense]|uniref:Uncharacterized protein n=1 Tax=Sinosporangium siamense TaxID=1367973 RepID=A0A919V5P9_9ACTN|nr:hypothetical protein [Sinosporangium siamense]GII91743.1 hypothetical protein Ssi02_19740 [Sinosporangium siamense]